MKWHTFSAVPAMILTVVLLGCGGRSATVQIPSDPAPPAAFTLAQLWVDPGDTPRDLYWGVGGEALAPSTGPFEVEGRDDSGFSVSYDVKSPDGTRWSAKVGPEAQTEVVLSRIL